MLPPENTPPPNCSPDLRGRRVLAIVGEAELGAQVLVDADAGDRGCLGGEVGRAAGLAATVLHIERQHGRRQHKESQQRGGGDRCKMHRRSSCKSIAMVDRNIGHVRDRGKPAYH